MAVYLIATLDTKGREAAFLRDELAARGVEVRLVDAGSLGPPAVEADIPREKIFQAAGASLAEIQQRADRGHAVEAAARGAAAVIAEAHRRGEVAGVMALGGSAGTTIGAAAMRGLPLKTPKLIISTLASGDVRGWVRDKNIFMLNSVVDIAGLNRVSRLVFSQAARAMAGMVQAPAIEASTDDKPLVAATMFGVTTPCVERARQVLEEADYEVLVFHATGAGGQAMESLIAEGVFAGVLDLTTTELADELVGGVLSAGPDRLTAAARHGTPQVVSVGALDMVNFHARDSVPERFQHRRLHQHNPSVTLMRATADESRRLGEEIGRKLAAARGPACIFLPLRGVSAIDRAGEPFDDPDARAALFDGVRSTHGAVELIELDLHINDAEFAERAARKLIELILAAPRSDSHGPLPA